MTKPDSANYLPLFNHPVDAESVFTPYALIEAVRAERGMSTVAVPKVCILEFDGDLTDRLVQGNLVKPWTTWACFHTPMFALEVNGEPCGIVPRAIGGSFAVLVAEQLLASGAKVVVGLTSAGSREWTVAYSKLGGCDCSRSRRRYFLSLPAAGTLGRGTGEADSTPGRGA